MRRSTRFLGVVPATLLLALVAWGASAQAAASTSGSQTFKGVIVTSGLSGERVLVSSVVVAKGVFDGVGRVVEIANLPGDPDNVSRDDLVFGGGTMHIVTTNLDFSVSVNPRSCLASFTVQQEGMVIGGTGRFAAASGSYTGTVKGLGLAGRNADGSCSLEQAALHEVDLIASSGTLSF